MDTLSAFARGQAAQGRPQRVFDWDRAAQLIRDRKAPSACAGLIEDWSWTGGEIFRDGAPIPSGDTYVYLSSNWATPVLRISGEVIECWKYEKDTPGWSSDTYWPDSAIAILGITEDERAAARG